ncbi:hypothetical protein [Thermocoleostomius sinensis]|uniref:Uncharacterized protein n=1 Tax=Thermocoleostomius sinensis A174 TaxID=2016057 RepID=A0A9E8ZDT2_9CYAN|nr:hypothetical protein [Thermocoleostomius sinensis]WAL60951.1 hypothetical protein OXH18_02835 [Thermocoleostomius sinensis A174]
MATPRSTRVWSASSDLDASPQSALQDAAIELQAYFYQQEGEIYRVEDLQRALENWLELSMEALVEDALFHVVEGDRSSAFNRSAFESQMKRLRPLDRPDAATDVCQPISAVHAA